MDRTYFQAIDQANECVRLTTMISLNANYDEAIRAASDPVMLDLCKDIDRLRRTISEIISLQKRAYEKSKKQ